MAEYKIIRSKRRTISLEISIGGEIIVRAPMQMSRKKIDKFVNDHRKWIESKTEIQRQRNRFEQSLLADEMQLRREAQEIIPKRVEYYSELMQLRPEGVKITSAKKRFGSCSSKNRLCFSWRLMAYDMDAVDYVIVHELAHLVHFNHSRQFYELIESYLPDYKRRRELLKFKNTDTKD